MNEESKARRKAKQPTHKTKNKIDEKIKINNK